MVGENQEKIAVFDSLNESPSEKEGKSGSRVNQGLGA